MKKAEIKRISNRIDTIEKQFNGWTTKKRVDGKVFRLSAEEQRRMFEQMEKASEDLSSMDSIMRLEQVRLMESKGFWTPYTCAEARRENPELWNLLERCVRGGAGGGSAGGAG